MIDLNRQFPEKLEELRELIGDYEVRQPHFIADTALYSYAFDVFEHTSTVGLLQTAQWPRTAYVNARSATEAAHDALYLVATRGKYDLNGALARAWESIEIETLARGRKEGRAILGLPQEATPTAAEDHILSDADFCEQQHAGMGRIMRQALETIQADKTRLEHWSGLSRSKRLQAVQAALGLKPGFAEGQIHAHSQLSIHTHPRLRLGTRQVGRDDTGKWSFSARSLDAEAPKYFAALACMCASVAIRNRPVSAS